MIFRLECSHHRGLLLRSRLQLWDFRQPLNLQVIKPEIPVFLEWLRNAQHADKQFIPLIAALQLPYVHRRLLEMVQPFPSMIVLSHPKYSLNVDPDPQNSVSEFLSVTCFDASFLLRYALLARILIAAFVFFRKLYFYSDLINPVA